MGANANDFSMCLSEKGRAFATVSILFFWYARFYCNDAQKILIFRWFSQGWDNFIFDLKNEKFPLKNINNFIFFHVRIFTIRRSRCSLPAYNKAFITQKREENYIFFKICYIFLSFLFNFFSLSLFLGRSFLYSQLSFFHFMKKKHL